MKEKIIITICILWIAVLMVLPIPLSAGADTFYVESDGNDADGGSAAYPWATIQGAIDNTVVEDGDIIYVGTGTYTENIVVHKSLTIYGDDADATIIRPATTGESVIQVTANDVTVRNLTIDGSDGSGTAGIYAAIDDFALRYCVISGNECGVYLKNSDDAGIYSNEFNNNEKAIYLYESNGADITYNYFEDNTAGIYLVASRLGTIDGNEFENGDVGIFLYQEDDDDDYYDDDDVTTLEADNDFDDMDETVYLGSEDDLDDYAFSCFINALRAL